MSTLEQPRPADEPPWWYQPCMNQIKKMKGVPCREDHCTSQVVKNYTEEMCSCSGEYPDGCFERQPPCCSYTAASPVPILSENCYCCCGCLARATPVAFASSEYKAIEEFVVGDPVYVADDVSLSTWSQQPVAWSGGTGPGQNTMIKVLFRRGEGTDFLLVNRDQPFLLADRTLKTASKLVPTVDSLLSGGAEALEVLSVQVGYFDDGLHHVATSTAPATSADKHLLLAKNVVCGDWALQLAIQVRRAEGLDLAEDFGALPELGTRAYEEAYADLEFLPGGAVAPGVDLEEEEAVESFTPFGATPGASIPENAQAFFTPEQAEELERNAPQAPPSSDMGRDIVENLFSTFGGFFPGIHFYLDNENDLPNVYLVEEFERRTVVFTGGLMRTNGFGFEGMALAIAHAIGTAFPAKPQNDDGFCCTPVADYVAVASVMPRVWLGLRSLPVSEAGVEQVAELFAAIKVHRGGSDACTDPWLDCRLQSMRAALHTMPLPHCAGGPPDPALELEGASGKAGETRGKVKLAFNLALDPATAADPGNYSFQPLVEVFEASVSKTSPEKVTISADLKVGTEYKVQVLGVLSAKEQPMVPGHDVGTFTAKGSEG